MKVLHWINTITLLLILGAVVYVADVGLRINSGVWYQVFLMKGGDVSEHILDGKPIPDLGGFQEPTEEWPYWNTAVRANPSSEDLLKTVSLTKESGCQITEKNFCTEIAYIWRKFDTDAATRAKFKAEFYNHLFQESRGDIAIRPRNQ